MRVMAFGLLALCGCGSIPTTYDFDPAADFTRLKTYAWWSESRKAEQPPTEGTSPLVMERIRRAGDRQLAARGFRRVESRPDFLVIPGTQSRQRTRVYERSVGYGYHYWGGPVDVYQYEEGSLILDVVDAKTDRLLWRGVGSAAIPESPKPDEITKIVDAVVEAVLKNFPPPR
jgi:hypothetical protein